MMEGLAPLARQFGVEVCLVEPGPINTEFVASVRATSQASIAAMTEPYGTLAGRYMGSTGDVFATYGQTGDDIARIIAALAVAEDPDFRTITSDFAKTMVSSKVVDQTGNSVIEIFANRLKG
jgi:NAD(P)-dependent dehydrogenase (short-subunit alcohol dehydrogenase family)